VVSPFLERGLNECLSLIARPLNVAPTSLFSEARTAKSPSKRRRRRASPLFLTISLDLSISVSPVAHLPSFFFQRKQEEKKNKKKPSLSLFFFFFSLSLSQTGNAEGTAPRTETSLLNSLPIPEIAVWKRSILLFREKEQRAARARASVDSKIPSRDNYVQPVHESRSRPIINGTCDQFNRRGRNHVHVSAGCRGGSRCTYYGFVERTCPDEGQFAGPPRIRTGRRSHVDQRVGKREENTSREALSQGRVLYMYFRVYL